MKRLLVVLLAGCFTSTPPPAIEPTPPQPKPQVAKRVITIRYNRMTYVMDTPDRQREAARLAIEGSELLRQIAALGLSVELEFDDQLGDDVEIVDKAIGGSLGRIELLHLARGEVGGIIESIKLTQPGL